MTTVPTAPAATRMPAVQNTAPATRRACSDRPHAPSIRYPRPRTVAIAAAPTFLRSRPMNTSTVFESRSASRRVDVLRQLALRDEAAAMVHQVREHAELVAGEADGRAVHGDARRAWVEHDRPAPERRHCLAGGPPDERSKPRQHLFHLKGLGHVVVGAAVDAGDLLVPASARRKDEDRHSSRRLRASAAAGSARPSPAGRGRAPRRRTARSRRGTPHARRRRRSPPHNPPRLNAAASWLASAVSSSTTSTRTRRL